MREGWEYKKLGEVCEVVSGSTPKTNVPEYWGEGHYWVTPAELNETIVYIDKTERQITDEALAKTKLRLLPVGTVLLSSRAPIGKVAITKTEMYCNQGFKNCICSDSIYNKYLFYFLRLKKEYLNSLGRGATFKEISKSIVESISIPLPPKSTQLAIVSELDKINELIRLKKEQLKDFDNLAQSLFYEMFGDPVENEMRWEVKKLGDNVEEMFLGPFGSALKVDSYVPKEDSYCMVYEQKHAIKKSINLENHYINKEKFDSLKRFCVMPGDFIMSCRGTIGKLYQIPPGAPMGIIHPSLMKIRLKQNGYDSTYFNFMLVKIVAIESTNGNCVQMAITAKALSKKELPLPPLPLQHLFAQRIEQIEHQKAEVQKSITDLETLLASRMQYWFE